MSRIRTDLALEAKELWRESADETTKLSGVEAYDETRGSFKISTVKILDEEGERQLGKPRGTYITIELDGLIRREENAFEDAANILAEELRKILKLEENASVLVVGLGNDAITPDAVGPETVDCVMVTRHLKQHMPLEFAAFRRVSAIQSGVLGTTGIESADIISAVCQRLSPDCVVAVDALASRRMDRLCRTIQIADTGIVPGSGVGNSRMALNSETLGIPVVAVGVPTVVDAATLTIDMAQRAGVSLESSRFGDDGTMIVTPRDIDRCVKDISKLIGYGLNLALHNGLTIPDIDMFLS
ncbi:MAG TPA: GPR endopeptidase [Clostridiales bacterium]|nr:GPR endopeptidase [Clostridiales bacterium]